MAFRREKELTHYILTLWHNTIISRICWCGLLIANDILNSSEWLGAQHTSSIRYMHNEVAYRKRSPHSLVHSFVSFWMGKSTHTNSCSCRTFLRMRCVCAIRVVGQMAYNDWNHHQICFLTRIQIKWPANRARKGRETKLYLMKMICV